MCALPCPRDRILPFLPYIVNIYLPVFLQNHLLSHPVTDSAVVLWAKPIRNRKITHKKLADKSNSRRISPNCYGWKSIFVWAKPQHRRRFRQSYDVNGFADPGHVQLRSRKLPSSHARLSASLWQWNHREARHDSGSLICHNSHTSGRELTHTHGQSGRCITLPIDVHKFSR